LLIFSKTCRGLPKMEKAFVTAAAAARQQAPMMRPSSARRLCIMRELVAEFARRNIGHTGVALFLGCSLSAARNYVFELLDAGVVASHPVRQAAGCVDRKLFRLAADPLAVRKYLAALPRSHGERGAVAWGDGEAAEPMPDVARIHRNWSVADFSMGAPARRDPLVAALFGAPRLS
jgi:hypothetical protein